VGISGTEEALPSGAKFPRPKKVQVVVGEAIKPPKLKAKRSELAAWTNQLSMALQKAQNQALE